MKVGDDWEDYERHYTEGLRAEAILWVVLTLAAAIVGSLLLMATAARAADRPAGCPPRLWCGCAMAVWKFGEPRKDLWAARRWAKVGRPASAGCVGCVAVLTRGRGGHVGIVQGYQGNNPVILSGNHNNAVGVGVYPTSRVIAWRWI